MIENVPTQKWDMDSPKKWDRIPEMGRASKSGVLIFRSAPLGCIVIGIAGSDEKVNYLLNDLKLDAAFNYKTTDLATSLAKIAPQGIDCYFDNVSSIFNGDACWASERGGEGYQKLSCKGSFSKGPQRQPDCVHAFV